MILIILTLVEGILSFFTASGLIRLIETTIKTAIKGEGTIDGTRFAVTSALLVVNSLLIWYYAMLSCL